MIEQFKTIQPDLGSTAGKEATIFLMIQHYYEQVFDKDKAKELAEAYINQWVQESFKENFW